MLLKKVPRKSATKNISIEKLLKKLSLEMFVKNSCKNAAKNVLRKNATIANLSKSCSRNNRT